MIAYRRSGLKIGWWPPATSMMLRRRIPNPKSPSTNEPASSGPRWISRSVWRSTTRRSTGRPPRLYHPAIPHIRLSPGLPPRKLVSGKCRKANEFASHYKNFTMRPQPRRRISGRFVDLEAGFEIGLVEAELLGLVEGVRTKAHRAIFADDLPVRRLVEILELEQLLGDDHIAFHPDHFGDVGRPAGTVAQALHLDDEVDRIRDLTADGL